MAAELSKEYTVIVPDLRNHGRSFHDSDTSYEALAGDIERLLDHLEIDLAVLCGHSMGGKCAMRFACLHRERVAGLIIEDMGPGKHPERYGKEVRLMRDLDIAGLSSRKDAEKQLGDAIGDRMMTLSLSSQES